MLLESIAVSIITPTSLLLSILAAFSRRASVSISPLPLIVATISAISATLCCLSVVSANSPLSAIVLALTLTQAVLPISLSSSLRGQARSLAVAAAIAVIACSGIALVFASTHLGLVLAFELMLFAALCLLRITAKAERAVEALTEMYLWSVVGSFALVSSLWVRASSSTLGYSTVSDLLLLVGFAVKVPLWPFSSWLLKAHVEASTEFSILLSGYLVKFGVIGLYRSLIITPTSDLSLAVLRTLAWVGMVESAFRLYYQVDLKRLIATLTILETNWLALCLCSDSSRGLTLGLALVLVHCWTTTTEFYLVELLYRRYSTRSALRVSGVWSLSPTLGRVSWAILLVTLGLPGTSIFALKFMFMAHLSSVSMWQLVIFSLVMLVIVPIALIRIWVPVICGQPSGNVSSSSLTRVEALLALSCLLAAVAIGFIPTCLVV